MAIDSVWSSLSYIDCLFFSLFWLYLSVFMYNDLIWYDIMGNVIWLFLLPLFWEWSWKPYVCVEHEPLHDETTPGNSRSRTRRDICLAWRFADLVCSFIFIIDGLYPDRFLGFRFIGFLVLASQAFLDLYVHRFLAPMFVDFFGPEFCWFFLGPKVESLEVSASHFGALRSHISSFWGLHVDRVLGFITF